MNQFSGKHIHIVGITGSEGSGILDYIIKQNPTTITGHDFINQNDIEKNYKMWHKGISEQEKEKLWTQFHEKIEKITFHTQTTYLQDIETADYIFVPQSWRLYRQNERLISLKAKKPDIFYTLTKLYLEFTKAKTIAITGTVGKGSTANLIYEIFKKSPPTKRNVIFAGNETWRPQVGNILDKLTEKDVLILEVSHRQLIDGIKKGPNIAVITNVYPNHLDEVSFDQYLNLKFSLLRAQSPDDIAVLNYDIRELQKIENTIKSKVVFFSLQKKEKNSQKIKPYFEEIVQSNKSQHAQNLLAAAVCCSSFGIDMQSIITHLQKIPLLPARMQYITEFDGITIYDDIKSTTPWGTLAALDKLGKKTILICGGDTKGVDYGEFLKLLPEKTKHTIILRSKLGDSGEKDLESAIKSAYAKSESGDNILISPAAAFFYTSFIKGKKSIRKILTSLPQ